MASGTIGGETEKQSKVTIKCKSGELDGTWNYRW
jgi:hypothetical protein